MAFDEYSALSERRRAAADALYASGFRYGDPLSLGMPLRWEGDDS